jgi:hypothetical protein
MHWPAINFNFYISPQGPLQETLRKAIGHKPKPHINNII